MAKNLGDRVARALMSKYGHRVAFLQKIFVIKRKDQICGAVVYVYPMSAAPCRSTVMNIETIKELNEKLSRLC